METKDRLNQLSPLTDKDHFFKKSVDQYTAAWQQKRFESFGGYADKYKVAFDRLIDVIRDNPDNKDQLAYPIMFLARHIIELRLKELVQLCNGEVVIFQKKVKCKLLELPDNFECKNNINKNKKEPTHSLSSLWNEFAKLYSSSEKNECYPKVGNLITELHQMDNHSDTFRYPIHKNGTPTAISEFVDVKNFIEVFLKVDDILKGLENELNQALDEMSNI